MRSSMVLRSLLAIFAAALSINLIAQTPPTPPLTPTPTPTPAATPAQTAAIPSAIPAGRAASKVAIITIHDAIDKWTAYGVERRLNKAVADGADAVVFDIDTPGGEMGACLRICTLIKGCPIPNTVAWINPNAYSAGAIIGLACREIVVNDPATFGDALPIAIDPLRGLQTLPDAEREKLIGPLLAEVVDSARRRGWDEMLVQGLVRRDVELWLVEHKTTGERLFVTAEQYKAAVGEEPPRGLSPEIPSVTGQAGGAGGGSTPSTPSTTPPSAGPGQSAPNPNAPAPKPAPVGPPAPPRAIAPGDPATDYTPAAPNTSTTLHSEVASQLEAKGAVSRRPKLADAAHAGQYKLVEYVSDGHGLVLMKSATMRRYNVAAAAVHNEAELAAFFGAAPGSLARMNETWSEQLVRLLTNPISQGLLVVVFLVALFIEMTHPGVSVPGVVAGICLLGLVIPPVLIDLAAWWMGAAVLLGLVMLLVEVFVVPGFGVFGLLGILLVFGGLVGLVVGGPSGLFPSSAQGRDTLAYGATSVLVSVVVAATVIFFIARNLPQLPVLNRFVLKNNSASEDSTEGLLAAMAGTAAGQIVVGSVGRTLTPLRPAGKMQLDDRVVDVVSEIGFVDAGRPVRVTSADEYRVMVEPC